MGDGHEWQSALTALDTLISGKQRSDGASWSDAFNMMRIYLQRLAIAEQISHLSVIHVAGTKGKGSTCALVEAMLRQAGYKTGLFTSPHLCDVRERVAINGKPISRETFLRYFWPVFDCLEKLADGDAGKPAYFRFLTLLGFKVFLEEKVDVAIIEVGLGGRLDATNCIPAPVVCGISSLGFDHMELLGNTLKEIATEKAGILKPGTPAFTSPQLSEAMDALQVKAGAAGIALEVAQPLETYSDARGGPVAALGLAGEHQRINAALAVALARTWEARCDRLPGLQDAGGVEREAAARAGRLQQLAAGRLPDAYLQGLQRCRWAGRSQIIEDAASAPAANGASASHPHPVSRLSFFIDGAHTPESMASCGQWFAEAATSAATDQASLQPPSDNHAQENGNSLVPELQRVLLFHCMKARDPDILLGALADSLTSRNVHMDHSLFVPLQSSAASVQGVSAGAPADVAWPSTLCKAWQTRTASLAHPPLRTALPPLPPVASMGAQSSRAGAVQPSLASAVSWMRLCIAQQPRLRLQVLVTGSLYLVGDLLKHLGHSSSSSS